MFKKKLLHSLFMFIWLLTACQSASAVSTPKPTVDLITFPKIDRHPQAASWQKGALTVLPTYDPNSTNPWQMDLRTRDLSALDLRASLNDLLYADFDEGTIWPTTEKMPPGFDRQQIMDLGKNPGLGIRKLHEQGITGRGVGIAIIDQALLVEHQEYADRLRLYEEIVPSAEEAAMHGAAVASIAVGKTLGVAPEADLYYINGFTGKCGETPEMYHCLAQGIRRILQINQQLPEERKIRVISISRGYMPGEEGSDDWAATILEANAVGVLVVYSNSDLLGLGRIPLTDPDAFQSYEPGLFWTKDFYSNQVRGSLLFVPMDSRTTASPHSKDKYVFYRTGGLSWAIPYTAGIYALAAQANPAITPDQFWKLAKSTGQTIEIVHTGKTYQLGPILDPVALIKALQP
jgi:hypothetical protein